MISTRRTLFPVFLVVTPVFSSSVVSAQTVGELEEIVVTAQKREESLQDVPIAITAISGEQLRSGGLRNSDEIQNLAPNMVWTPAGGVGSVVGIRGIVDVNFTSGQVGSVAIVSDEVGLNSPAANTFAMLDLERVEVLRGPQVTLYGRSTTGGAVSFISRRPEPGAPMDGYAEVSVGNLGNLELQGAASLPLGDRAALRVAALSQSRDDYIDNPTTGRDEGERERTAFRVSLVADLSDQWRLYAKAHMGKQRADGSRYKDIGYFRPADSATPCGKTPRIGNGCADAFAFVDSKDYDENFSNVPDTREDIDLAGGLLNLSWTSDTLRFTSISAYERNEYARNEDTDGSPTDFIEVSTDAETEQFTQEFRLASADDADLRWMVGAYYLKEQQDDGITTLLIRPADVFLSTNYDQDDEIYSGYAQLDLMLNEHWSLNAGVRYSDETKDGVAIGLAALDDLAGRGVPGPGAYIDAALARSFADPALYAEVPLDKTWKNWGGKLGIDFTPSEDVLVYASVSRSFKGGVFNLAAGPILADPADAAITRAGVDPEKLWAYELGAKLTLLDGRMQLDLAAFYNDYTDQQLYIIGANLGIYFINAAAATIKGAEAEMRLLLSEGTTLTAGFGYLDGTYDELVSAGTDLSGNSMVLVPEMNGHLGVRQEWQLGAGTLSADLSLRYQDSMYFDIFNVLDESEQYTADARLEYAFGEEENFRVSLWGKNITDERFVVQAFDLGTNAQVMVNNPRTYGLALRAEF